MRSNFQSDLKSTAFLYLFTVPVLRVQVWISTAKSRQRGGPTTNNAKEKEHF